jgi:hypothetical protein
VVSGFQPAVGTHRCPGAFHQQGLQMLAALTRLAVLALAGRFCLLSFVAASQCGAAVAFRVCRTFLPGLGGGCLRGVRR